MARPTKHARIRVLAPNIFFNGEKLLKGQETEILRAEAKAAIEADNEAGRAPRIKVLTDADS